MLANLESGMDEMFAGMRERLGMEPKAAASNFEEDDGKVNELSHELDVDTLNANFQKYAGLDDTLSRAEYDKFVKEEKIPPSTAGILWSLLDRDNSGEVSKDEFHSALLALQQNRSWARYCPSCEYRNDCAFCQECNSGCPHRRLRQTRPGLRCSEVCFCASCWNDHPGRQQTMEELVEQDHEPHPFGSTEYLRENLVIRPLEWAYHSRALRGIPVQYKAGMRQLLADQKQKATAAAKEAMAELTNEGPET